MDIEDTLGKIMNLLDMEEKLTLSSLCKSIRATVAFNVLNRIEDWSVFLQEEEIPQTDNVGGTLDDFFSQEPEEKPHKTTISAEDIKYLPRFVHLTAAVLELPENKNMLLNSYESYFPLAARFGRTTAVKTFLTEKGEKFSGISKMEFYGFRKACQNGHTDVVKLFLDTKQVDVSIHQYFCYKKAAENGHLETLQSLLKFRQIPLNIDDNYMIKKSSYYGHTTMIQYLLQFPEVNPKATNNYALRFAAQNGHLESLRVLLERIELSDNDCEAMTWAATCGRVDAMKILLEKPGFPANCRNNYAIQWAARSGHLSMVKYLCDIPSVDPTANNNFAVYWASRNGYKEVVTYLLKFPGVEIPQETLEMKFDNLELFRKSVGRRN